MSRRRPLPNGVVAFRRKVARVCWIEALARIASPVASCLLAGATKNAGLCSYRTDVIEHYDEFFKLRLTDQEKRDLGEYLKSL